MSPKHVDLDPLEPIPAHVIDALNELVGTYVSPNFELRIRAADPTVVEVVAGAGDDQVTAAIDGRWRWIAATISRAGLAGAARTLDVHITAAENIFAAPNPALGQVGEQDATDHSFALAVTEAGAQPAGVALARKIGSGQWDGAKFATVSPILGKGAAANTTQVVKIVGDGTVGPFDFLHGLQTYDVGVEVYRSSAPRATVDVAVERPDVNTVRIRPDVAIPASGAVILVTSRGTAAGAIPPHGTTHLPGVGTDPTGLPVITSAAALAAIPLVHGQEVYFLADQTVGVMWHLRCRLWQADGVTPNPSSSKWDVIAGDEVVSEVTTFLGSTLSAAYVSMGLPSVAVPVAGDYFVRHYTAAMEVTAGVNTQFGYLSYGIGGAAASDGDAVGMYTTANQAEMSAQQLRRRKVGLAAGAMLQMQARIGVAQAGAQVYPNAGPGATAVGIALRPIRVG